MRGREPCVETFAIGCYDFVEGQKLPGAVVDVIELIEHACFDAARLRNRRPGRNAAFERTRVHDAWLPPLRDAFGNRFRLSLTPSGQSEVRPTTKSLWLDPFDMSVTDQKNLRHLKHLPRTAVALSA